MEIADAVENVSFAFVINRATPDLERLVTGIERLSVFAHIGANHTNVVEQRGFLLMVTQVAADHARLVEEIERLLMFAHPPVSHPYIIESVNPPDTIIG